MHIKLIKLRIKHPKTFSFFKEGGSFLLIFFIVFIAVFATFNGRAFYEQVKYSFRINIEKSEDFLQKLPKTEELYDFPDSVVIPKININAPIVVSSTVDEKELFKKLENGVLLYPNSALPGQNGNTIILGHSSAYPWYKGKYGSVFSLLNQLNSGEQIIVYFQKHRYIYRVIAKSIILKNAEILVQGEKPQLVLISCWPVGTAWKRIMIQAEIAP